MALPAMNPILQQFAHRQTALQHVEHAPFQKENPLALLVAALGGHHRSVDAGMHHPPPMGPRHHPLPGSPIENAHHGELGLDLSPHHQETGFGGVMEPPFSGLPNVLPSPAAGPSGSHGEVYTPPIRRRPDLMQALSNVGGGGGSAVHPYGMV